MTCQHLNCSAAVDFFKKINADDQETVISRSVHIAIHCKDCGMPFHFPHFTPANGGNPGVNADGTTLKLPVLPGKANVLWSIEEDEIIPEFN
jgi:hypothetical protein